MGQQIGAIQVYICTLSYFLLTLMFSYVHNTCINPTSIGTFANTAGNMFRISIDAFNTTQTPNFIFSQNAFFS